MIAFVRSMYRFENSSCHVFLEWFSGLKPLPAQAKLPLIQSVTTQKGTLCFLFFSFLFLSFYIEVEFHV